MASLSHPARPSTRGFFIVTPYIPDQEGILRAEVPDCCPLSSPGGGGPPCRVDRHHLRSRKTGPCFPLTVVRCRTHRKHFTLYPPGYAPYGRQPLVQQAPDGSLPIAAGPLEAFQGTLFQAALDARDGRAWARHSRGHLPDRWWSTQGRHLDLASRLLGLFLGLEVKVREAVAVVLSLDLLLLLELAQVTSTAGYRKRGKAISDVLQAITPRRDRGQRLLLCGHLIGHWAVPVIWDRTRKLLQRLPFRAPVHPRPP